MKKQKLLTFAAAAMLLLSVTSCSSIESDAKKAAEMACEAQQMAMDGDFDMEKMQEMQQEAQELYTEMEGKYQSMEDMEKFAEAYQSALENCK